QYAPYDRRHIDDGELDKYSDGIFIRISNGKLDSITVLDFPAQHLVDHILLGGKLDIFTVDGDQCGTILHASGGCRRIDKRKQYKLSGFAAVELYTDTAIGTGECIGFALCDWWIDKECVAIFKNCHHPANGGVLSPVEIGLFAQIMLIEEYLHLTKQRIAIADIGASSKSC